MKKIVFLLSLFLVFALAAPVGRLDAGEFQGLLHARLGDPVRSVLTDEDVGFVKSLIAVYGAAGVDVASAQAAVDANAKRLEAERQQALQQEELCRQQEASRLQQAAAEVERKRATLKTKKWAPPAAQKPRKGKSRSR